MPNASNPLVPHDPRYRRLWMFPRNIRKIYPWKVRRIFHLFLSLTSGRSWSGDQDLQDSFRRLLDAEGLLQKSRDPYHPRSGGPRTYLAQLKALGLLFEGPNNIFSPTLAGEELLNGSNGLSVMQHMLLRHQYPSSYSNLSQVGIHPAIKVKPFLFMLRLLSLPSLKGYLTVAEMAVPVIYGHNPRCLEICTEKILKLRASQTSVSAKLLSVIDTPEEDLYTPRSANNHDLNKRLEDVLDIANTCKNYMEACLLIEELPMQGLTCYARSEYIEPLLNQAFATEDRFISYLGSDEAFQRNYGCLERLKDTRRVASGASSTISIEESLVLADFVRLCGQRILSSDAVDDFCQSMFQKHALAPDLTREIIEPHLNNALSLYESTFLELSRSGARTAIEFEKALTQLFNERLFFKAEHTGQRRAPFGRVGGFSDVFAVALDNRHCALLDAKASPSYVLSSNDYHSMVHSYVPHYRELCDGRDLDLEFCAYVAYGFSTGVNQKLEMMNRELENLTRVSAIKARDLLEISKKENLRDRQKMLRALFKNSRILARKDFLDANLL